MSRIEIRGLSKRFGSTVALDSVSVEFGGEKIYGLLGRNGAGKSTLLKVIANRIFADAGAAELDGQPLAENPPAQRFIHYMGEGNLFPEGMRVRDAFKWVTELRPGFDLLYANALAEEFGLNPKTKTAQLSTGYGSIFKLIVALASNVPVTLLDEPVLGLDAYHRDIFYKRLLENFIANPRTFVLSTHLIEEVSALVEHVVIIDAGRVILDTPAADAAAMGYTVTGSADKVDAFIQGKNVLGSDSLGGMRSAYVLGSFDKNVVPAELEFTGLELQRLFIQLTGGRIE